MTNHQFFTADQLQYFFRNGQWGSYRHLTLVPHQIPPNPQSEVSAFLSITNRGDLSSLKWIQQPLKLKTNGKHEVVRVHYAALNFRDVMIATGRVGPEMFGDKRSDQLRILGFEFSGVTLSGRRVYGIATYGCLVTHFTQDRVILLDVPKCWSLEEAATVLGTYGTIAVGLFMKCRIERGKSILIHAGSGGVGLSTLHVAFAFGMEVFTTVGSDEKRQFLLETFPKLKPENIGNSRNTSFEDMIMKQTKGHGVNYVLNSLADDKLLASLRCVGRAGFFIEIGKSDIVRDNKINLAPFANELTFLSVNMVNFIDYPGASIDVSNF
jgi:fatty acid synthase